MIVPQTPLYKSRDDMAATLIAGVPAPERTLMVELVANGFVDGYTSALSNGRFGDLIDWADRMCEAHADTPGVATFFDRACGSLEEYFAPYPTATGYRAPLVKLAAPMRALAAKARNQTPQVHERLDEVDAAINGMLVRLDQADPLTAEHSRAVAAWCLRIARRLTLSEEQTNFVARCGMIHDIGKVTTPKEILFAPRALTDDEWKSMRDHTSAGERIVKADPVLQTFSVAVRSHHERLDGRGYPDGLTKNDLNLATKIVTVADCFNAMIGRRPYRPPMPPGRALEQLLANKSTQFDPEIVAAMQDVVRSG